MNIVSKYRLKLIVITSIVFFCFVMVADVAVCLATYFITLNSVEADLEYIVSYEGEIEPNKRIVESNKKLLGNYYYVTFNENNEPIDDFRIYGENFIERFLAIEYAKTKLLNEDFEGRDGNILYQGFNLSSNPEYTRFVFLNAEDDFNRANNYIIIVCGISLVCYFVCILINIFFSRKLLKPMVKEMENEKQFVSDINHEIKTPLTIMKMNNENIDLIYGENKFTESTSRQIDRLVSLTDRLSYLVHLEEYKVKTKFEDFNISDLLYYEIENFEPYLKKENKIVNAKIEDDVYCYAESYVIKELFSILLDNAIKYGDGEVIDVELNKVGTKIYINFKNESDGINQNTDFSRVFERFYRLEAHQDKKKGTGIGLALAKQIVLYSDGKISAHCEGEKTFVISIILKSSKEAKK